MMCLESGFIHLSKKSRFGHSIGVQAVEDYDSQQWAGGIGVWAFYGCGTSRIVIHPTVRAIKEGAFMNCSGLMTVILCNGLKVNGQGAFNRCVSLSRITIPPAAMGIDEDAFYENSNLMSVVFCDEIKRIVFGESMLDWLNRGVHDHEKCLSTYLLFCPMQNSRTWFMYYQGCGGPIFTTC